MNVERLFQTIAEIAGEKFGVTITVKEITDESVVHDCRGNGAFADIVRDRVSGECITRS